MKKCFLILALCCAVAFAGCKKDEIEITSQIPQNMEKAFPDHIFRAYVLENFDTDGDGKISKEEAEAVTKIIVVMCNIKSLEGIQYFTNLTHLYCYYNQLTTLDVSKNTQLTTLWCYSNQLTTLDVSKNTQLTELYCYSNQLTTLDVSGCTQLTELRCYSNQLTTLDVSGCTQLTELYCYSNQLTTLDVSKNTQLTLLYCYSNQLTTLDVSKNTQLKYLYCDSNQLTTLDVSKTNLGNSTRSYPLSCAPMSTLKTLYLKKGWSIKGITEDSGRSTTFIPAQTQIVFVD